MDGQRQQPYMPGPPLSASQPSQAHIMPLPPPPPRYTPAQPQNVVPPPPPGPPPGAAYGTSKLTNPQLQSQNNMGWPSWSGRGVHQYLPPPPPPPMTHANQSSFSRQPTMQNNSATSATYVPSAGTFGPGVGIPPFDVPTFPPYDPPGTMIPGDRPRPPLKQPYGHGVHNIPPYAEGTIPSTPSSHNPPSQDSPQPNPQATSQGNESAKSSSHRHNNSNTTVGGMSASEAAVQWPLDRVLIWLAKNGFSHEWQETFKALELEGAEFLELGHGQNGRPPNLGKLHNVVYPQLQKECEASGIIWDLGRERDQGVRLRKLIRHIHGEEDGQGSAPDEGAEFSPNFPSATQVPASPSINSATISSSPNLKASRNPYTKQRNFTTPGSISQDSTSAEIAMTEGSPMMHRAELSRLNHVGADHQRKSPSMSSDNGLFAIPPQRPHENSPKSGSPATQHATLYSLNAPSTGDVSSKHSRAPSGERRYYETFKADGSRPSPQEYSNRQIGGHNNPSYPKDHRMGIFNFWRKPKSNDPNNPSPDDAVPGSPIYSKYHNNSSDVSVNERPVSASLSDYEKSAMRSKLANKGRRFIFATSDGVNYRLIETTDIDSVEMLRVNICQNLGITDWPDAQIFLTEPGQLEHEEPLNDSFLAYSQRTKSDPFGSLKLFVRGSHLRPGLNASNGPGLGVSIPDKPAASPTSTVPPRKPLDGEALSRISPLKPFSQQQQNTLVGKLPLRDNPQSNSGVSPVGEDTDGTLQEDFKREQERKQKHYGTSPAPLPLARPDAYNSETGYRRKGVINFDKPRISPYEDKKSDGLTPFRKPPSAPQESNTLSKVNSLRKRDNERPRPQRSNQPPGIKEMMKDMGMMTGAVGNPLPSPNSVNSSTPGKTLMWSLHANCYIAFVAFFMLDLSIAS